MFDMMKMMGKLKEVQEKMKEAQASLGDITVTSESGAGMVKATVNGHKEVVALDIDPSLFNEQDQDLIKDLIIAAINKGIKEAEAEGKEKLKKITEGVIPNIPGFDLNGMM